MGCPVIISSSMAAIDLTAAGLGGQVLTGSVSESAGRLMRASVVVGNYTGGTMLDGTGGDFVLTVVHDSRICTSKTFTLASGTVMAVLTSDDFMNDGSSGTTQVFLFSPNAADDAVHCSAGLYDTHPLVTSDGMVGVATGGITADSYDQDTAFPLASIDFGATALARKGASAVDLSTLTTALETVGGTVNLIQAKTSNLPASPAAVGSNMGTVSSVTGDVAGKVLGGGTGTIAGDGVQATKVTGNVEGKVLGGGVTVITGSGVQAESVAGDVAGKVLGGGAGTITGTGARAALAAGAITAVAHDASTAFPLAAVDSGATQVARKGASAIDLTTVAAGVAATVDALSELDPATLAEAIAAEVAVAALVPCYVADVNMASDDVDNAQRYIVQWSKDGVPCVPLASVLTVQDANNQVIIQSQTMVKIGNVFTYTATGDSLLDDGVPAVVQVAAVIDGAARVFAVTVSRDKVVA